jgi:hypothetical protein
VAITNGSRSKIESGATVMSTIETPGPKTIPESYRLPDRAPRMAIAGQCRRAIVRRRRRDAGAADRVSRATFD